MQTHLLQLVQVTKKGPLLTDAYQVMPELDLIRGCSVDLLPLFTDSPVYELANQTRTWALL